MEIYNYKHKAKCSKNKKIKKINKGIKISTWNVRTLLATGKMQEIGLELKRYNIDIAAIQEVRWEGQGNITKKHFTMFYSGGKKQGKYGVAFLILGNTRNKVIDFKPINERLAYIRIEAKPFNISILNVYAPTEGASAEEKEKLYEKMEEEIAKIEKEDTIMLLGDFNAQIGKEAYLYQVAGKHTIHDTTNDNGHRLCNFATRMNMVISSTKFQHPLHHKITWISPDQKYHSQIDHLLVCKRKQSSVMDVRTYRGACADSDHFMVVAKIIQKIKNSKKNKVNGHKWDVEKMSDTKIKDNYIENVVSLLTKNTMENDIDIEWNKIKICMEEAAKNQLGFERNKLGKDWYDEECQKMVNEKNKARLNWIRTKKEMDKIKYDVLRKNSYRMIRSKKKNKDR